MTEPRDDGGHPLPLPDVAVPDVALALPDSGNPDLGLAPEDLQVFPTDTASSIDLADGAASHADAPAPSDEGSAPDRPEIAPAFPDGTASSCASCRFEEYCDPTTDRCRVADRCATHADCPDGFRCVEPGFCRPAPPPRCLADEDCPDGWSCDRWHGGNCRPPASCASDADCWAGLHCSPATRRCTQCDERFPCPGRQQCLPGPLPLNATCADAARCATDEDCPGERICRDGACRAPACPDDQFEPDSAPFQAPLITDRTYPDQFLCGCDQEDWRRLVVPGGAGVQVILEQETDFPVQLSLYQAGPPLTLLREDRSGGQRQAVLIPGDPHEVGDQTYLVRVSSALGLTRRYTLHVLSDPAGFCEGDPWDRAPGDPIPAPLTDEPLQGVLCPRTLDRFQFAGEAGTEILARSGSSAGLAAPQIMLQDEAGGLLSTGVPTGDGGWETRALLPQTGSYLLLLSGEPPARGTPYTLELERGPDPVRARCERAPLLEEGTLVEPTAPVWDDQLTRCGPAGQPEGLVRLELPEETRIRVDALRLRPDGSLEPDPDAILSLRGSCSRPGAERHCSTGGSLELGRVFAGQYQLLVERAPAAQDFPSRLQLQRFPAAAEPAEVDCRQAAQLMAGEPRRGSLWPVRSSSANRCAPEEPAAPALYYRFELPAARQVSFTTSSFSPLQLCVMGSCDGAPLLSGPGPGVLREGTYLLRVAAEQPTLATEFDLLLQLANAPPPPVHTHCMGAAPLAEGQAIMADTRLAVHSAAPFCPETGPDLYYRVAIPHRANEADPRRVLLVWLQADFSFNLAVARTCDGPVLGCWAGTSDLEARSVVEPGEVVLGVGGQQPQDWGSLRMVVSLPDPPAGDRCLQASELRPGATVQGDTTTALDDPPSPAGVCGEAHWLAGPDIHHRLTLGPGERLNVRLSPQGWDGALLLLDGCPGNCLARVDQGWTDEDELLDWVVPPDAPPIGVYFLVVDSFAGYGPYRLTRTP